MNKYYVEFGHIYAHEMWGIEQEESHRIFKTLVKTLPGEVLGCLLIDNYNSSEKTLPQLPINNIEVFKEKDLADIAPFYIEKLINLKWQSLNKYQKEVLTLQDENKTLFLKERINGQERFTCCLLTAIWIIERHKKYPEAQLISILPKKYETNEKKALHLLECLGYGELKNKIKYLFY